MDDYGPGALAVSKPKPMMCMDQRDLPEIKDAKIGDKLTLTIEVVVKELRSRSYDTADNKGMIHAELQIQSVKKGGA